MFSGSNSSRKESGFSLQEVLVASAVLALILALMLIRTAGGEIKIQSYEIEFQDSTAPWPVPLSWGESVFTSPPPHRRKLFENRDPGSGTGRTVLGRGGSPAQQVEVIRTVESKEGDARMLGGLSRVPASYFAPGEGYFGSGRMSGSLLYSKREVVPEAQFGKHVDTTFKAISSLFVSELAVLPARFDDGPLTSLCVASSALAFHADGKNGPERQ